MCSAVLIRRQFSADLAPVPNPGSQCGKFWWDTRKPRIYKDTVMTHRVRLLYTLAGSSLALTMLTIRSEWCRARPRIRSKFRQPCRRRRQFGPLELLPGTGARPITAPRGRNVGSPAELSERDI